ncbi:caspase domain-containing protein [Gloeopeniophorella convolvens]|nr:caspase domain-containing protein [Gloeopeniophorella convolvens]
MAYYPTQPWPQEPLHGSPAVSHSHSPAISRRRAAPTSQWQASQANVPGPYMPHAEPYNPAHDRAAGGNYQYGGNISTPSGTFLDNRAFAPSTPPQVPAREPRPHRLQEYTPTSPPPRYQPAQTVLSPPASYGAPPQGLGDQSIPRRVPPSSYYRPPQTALQRSDRPTISLPIPATEHRTFPTAYPDLQANRGDATNYGFSNVPDVFLLPNNYNMSVPVGSIHTAPGWGTQGNQFPNHMNAIGGPSAHSQHQPAPTRVSQQNPPDLLCDGSKKAVIIGINYVGSYFPDVPKLKGCIQDAIAIADFIHKYYHFRKEDILILVDDPEALGGSGWTCWAAPTRANIILAMNWLIDNAQKNGSLFFYCMRSQALTPLCVLINGDYLFSVSGHGSQVEDQNGDESDGWDECIWTMNDVPGGSNGEIIDDQIHKIMVKGRSLPRGCRLTALFDVSTVLTGT